MPKIPKRTNRELCAVHWAGGALDEIDVPVTTTKLDEYRVIIQFPAGAAVERAEGDLGDGYETAKPKGPSMKAVLLFLERCSALKGIKTLPIWLECLKEAIERPRKPEQLMPPEAVEAMRMLVKQQSGQAKRKTAARRIGLQLAQILIEKP
jgi:hypothetical protein